MDHSHSESILIVLAKGEEIIASLKDFCANNNISGGWVRGLGSVKDIELASYDMAAKKYLTKTFPDAHELASLTGNIALLKDETVLHIHAVITDQAMKAVGGHLNHAEVAATCEIILEPFEHEVIREFDKETGLNLIA